MIRKMQKTDINRVAEIWLDTNMKAHDFIASQYWTENFNVAKELIEQSEVYVFKDGNKIQGFVGLNDEYIEGIFVWSEVQSKGIGKQLLDFIKGIKKQLTLSVYQKNTLAVKFYQREKFKIQHENIDANTGEKEYFMIWKQT